MTVETPLDGSDTIAVVPRQWRSGGALFCCWLVACAIDYGVLVGCLVGLLLAHASVGLYLVVMVLLLGGAQPLLEATGGTLGQRLMGVRLVAPGTAEVPSLLVIAKRHAYRIGILWGVVHALGLWIALGRATAEGRLFLARDQESVFEWIFIDR